MNRYPLFMLAAALGFGCGGATPGRDAGALADASARDAEPTSDAGPSDGPCTAFEPPTSVGVVDDATLNELSGLAASRAYPSAIYAHNDSGGEARLFVLDDGDASIRGTITLSGATARDWEDIAVGPGADGAPWVFVGDTGDNAARGGGTGRDRITIYRFPEADVDASAAAIDASVTAEAVDMTYPDAPHDCEAIAVAPNGDLYLLSKENTGPSTLYVARAPFETGLVLEMVTTVDIGGPIAPGNGQATAMDLSPGGRALLVRTYNRVHLFTREPEEDWAAALLRPATRLPAARELQGEAISWHASGRAYVTISERVRPTLYHFDASAVDCTPL